MKCLLLGITDYIKTRLLYENSCDMRITFSLYDFRNS